MARAGTPRWRSLAVQAVVVGRRRFLLALIVAIAAPALVVLAVSNDTERVFVPFGLFILVVVFATLIGRLIPGLIAVLVSVAVGWYFYLPERESFDLRNETDFIALVVLMSIALVVSVVLSFILARVALESGERTRAELELVGEQASTRTFQLALIPKRLPSIDGITIGAGYVAGGAEVVVGGDWYASIPLDDHRLGLAIGDVSGRGLAAVAAMAETRFALRTLASEDYPPEQVLDKVNMIMCKFREDLIVTAIYGVLDVRAHTWTQASAGHVPAITVSTKGSVRFLDDRPGPPLGVGPASEYTARTCELDRDDLLVLYTDGLVERRGEDLDVGFRRLATAVLGIGLDHEPDQLVNELIDRCAHGTPDDDVAVLLARVDGLEVPATTATAVPREQPA